LQYALLDAVRGDNAYRDTLLTNFPPKDLGDLIEFFQRDAYQCSAIKRLVVNTSDEKFKSLLEALDEYVNSKLALALLKMSTTEGPLAYCLSTWGTAGHELLMLLLEKTTECHDFSTSNPLEQVLAWKPSASGPDAFCNMGLQIGSGANREHALRALRLLTRLDEKTMFFVNPPGEKDLSQVMASLLGALFIEDSLDNEEAATALFEFIKRREELRGGLGLLLANPFDFRTKNFLPAYAFEILLKYLASTQKGELIEIFFAPRGDFVPLFHNMLAALHADKEEYNFAFEIYRALENASDAKRVYIEKLHAAYAGFDEKTRAAIFYADDSEWNNFVDNLRETFEYGVE
jgi:hypothetical protein